MKKTIIAIAIAAVTATAFSAPSVAAPMRANLEASTTLNVTEIRSEKRRYADRRYDRRILPAHRIARKLYRQGYRDITRIRLKNNRHYVVRAFTRRGPVKLIVNARNGQVIKRQRIGNRGHYNRPGFTFGGQRGGWSWSYTIR